jgi:plasmid stability protein
MASLQMRNLPHDVYEALALRAEHASRSLEQQVPVE